MDVQSQSHAMNMLGYMFELLALDAIVVKYAGE
jgi:hypothetical protein